MGLTWRRSYPPVAAGASHTYTLKGRSPAAARTTPGLSFEAQGRNLKVSLDQRLLTEYRVDAGNKPFFFPLVGPTGESYTREYPLSILPDEDHDHPHQRSCWFTYGNVNGIDFWSEGKRFGTVKENERTLVVAGPVIGRLKTTNEWRAADDQKVCTDERTRHILSHEVRADHRLQVPDRRQRQGPWSSVTPRKGCSASASRRRWTWTRKRGARSPTPKA